MSAFFESGLSFLLFLPAFAIIAVLYCAFPRVPRGAPRRFADVAVGLLAGAASVIAMRHAFHAAGVDAGPIWRQIVATLASYGAFLGILAVALPLRARWFARLRARFAARRHER